MLKHPETTLKHSDLPGVASLRIFTHLPSPAPTRLAYAGTG